MARLGDERELRPLALAANQQQNLASSASVQTWRAHVVVGPLSNPAARAPGLASCCSAQARVTPEVAVFVRGPDDARTLAYHGRIDDRVVEFGKLRATASAHELREAVDAVLDGRTPAPAGGPAIGCYISDLR